MIQYVDDLAYLSQHMDEQETPGMGGMIKNILWQGLKYQGGMDTLSMLKSGYRTGFYVPWTRNFKKNTFLESFDPIFGKGNLAKRATQTFGKRGWQFSSPIQRAVSRDFERAGMFRIRGATANAAAKYGSSVAERAASKFIISRIAGFALGVVNPIMWGSVIASVGTETYNIVSSQVNKYKGLELGGYFPESQGAYTSRQRMVQAITASHLQARSAIGNEAQLFHR